MTGADVHTSRVDLAARPHTSATELAAALRRGDLGAEEITATCLARIAALDPCFHAFITVDAEGALSAARALDGLPASARGPLHGVPIAIKDLTDTAGLRTTYGSLAFADHVPEADDLIVARLRRAGAVIVGKTNTPEFGFGAVCTNRLCGPTRNPWDIRLTSGGSSGGSAVAVATGMVSLAHGTDFGGSVRTPASFCGIASLRPTPGALPSPTRVFGWDNLATAGFLATTVDDLRLALTITAGPDLRDPLSLRDMTAEATLAAPLRLAASEDLGQAPVAQAVRTAFRGAVEGIDPAVARVTNTHPDCGDAFDIFHVLRPALIRHLLGPLAQHHGETLTPTVRWWIEHGEGIDAGAYLAAEAARTALYRRFIAQFDTCDALLLPAASVLPWPNERADITEIDGIALATIADYLAITYIVSLVGCPVVTLPAAMADGLPVGIQIVGAPGSDTRLLTIAERLERSCGWQTRSPVDRNNR
ncbi:amidase [Xanthobacteraceae bacterium Astr-EGSB]|uniref:amidase n=1 Tax=Astrobacterium formosum TaxID=3069710 RepID=UPI0027B6D085|nr:amidase [Xanthobacteraceae bacterium Astr-EGSB]